MLKHVQSSVSMRQERQQRGVSPAPSSSSISTEDSGSSWTSSTSASSTDHVHLNTSSVSSGSWTPCPYSRTSSRLSLSENPNAVPMRIYAACLRPDIQYKTVGVLLSTTAEEVVETLLRKCKVRFKDPRLFHIVMQIDIRGPNGCDTRASLKLEDGESPLQLQECYPKGQARFCLEMKAGKLVKIFDGSKTVGWEYKSIMISENTTTGELVDILFRYSMNNAQHFHYTLHLEVKDWKRCLRWDEVVSPALEMARPWGLPRLVLQSEDANSSPQPMLLPAISTTSLYDNVSSSTLDDREWCQAGRRQSLSVSPPSTIRSGISLSDDQQIARAHYNNHKSLSESVLASFTKLKLSSSRHGKYQLSEAFFV